ncbi:hypothetical protein BYT27DRAFT_6365973 [Phlegmacium glaucopus]|nr:hypothetical protein BYT27DRAFT_6365973 [Phlegmacium glaucopus]
MNSNIILRRIIAARSAARHRGLALRSYTTPSQEPDPQLDGYPQLSWQSRQNLPPLGWQDNLTRRNFGDTLHEQEEVLSMWGPDPAPIPIEDARRQFLMAVVGFIAFGFLVKAITPEPPAIRREYPFDGLIKELGGVEENKARPESFDSED